jgi:hypothetical protein
LLEIVAARTPSHPEIRCGFYYEDRWISPYLRVDFVLREGRHILEFEAYAPQFEEFDDACLQVRMGLLPLFESEPMSPGCHQWHRIELPTPGNACTVPIVFRSSVRWRAPDPDRRLLGLVLPSLQCVTESGNAFGISSAA